MATMEEALAAFRQKKDELCAKDSEISELGKRLEELRRDSRTVVGGIARASQDTVSTAREQYWDACAKRYPLAQEIKPLASVARQRILEEYGHLVADDTEEAEGGQEDAGNVASDDVTEAEGKDAGNESDGVTEADDVKKVVGTDESNDDTEVIENASVGSNGGVNGVVKCRRTIRIWGEACAQADAAVAARNEEFLQVLRRLKETTCFEEYWVEEFMSADSSLNMALDTKRRFDAMMEMELENAKLEEASLSVSSGNGGVRREESGVITLYGVIKLVDYSSSSSDEAGVIKLVDYSSSSSDEAGVIKLVDYSSSSSDEAGAIKLVDYSSSSSDESD